MLCQLPEKWKPGGWFKYHNDAPAPSASSVCLFLRNNKMTVTPLTQFISFSAAFLLSFSKTQEGIKGNDTSQRDYFE